MKRILIALLLLTPIVSYAGPIQLSFQATAFDMWGTIPLPAPQDPVSGQIVYDAPSLTSAPDTLTSIALSIDGYTYNIGDVETGIMSSTGFAGLPYIGGIIQGSGVFNGANDFRLIIDPTIGTLEAFVYSSANYPRSSWNATEFPSFSLTDLSGQNPVPEPSILGLLLIGILGLGLAKRAR